VLRYREEELITPPLTDKRFISLASAERGSIEEPIGLDARSAVCPTENYDILIGGTVKTAERRSLDPDSFRAFRRPRYARDPARKRCSGWGDHRPQSASLQGVLRARLRSFPS
jgi:hypothetical protein